MTGFSLMGDIQFKKVVSLSELEQILALQKKNLPDALSTELMHSEGFLTIKHDMDLLSKMNSRCPHSIAVHDYKVIGYALSMHPDFENSVDILKPMFKKIKTQLPRKLKFVVMGQICIDHQYRGKGIFKGLYDFMRHSLKCDFDWIITEVDMKNRRSLNAHLNSGFKILTRYSSNNRDWVLIYSPTSLRSDSAEMPQ